jgi:hypothetical protein
MAPPAEKRVILIGPDDVESELETIKMVVGQANHLVLRERLNLWHWRTDAMPGMHEDGPQGLTGQRMRISDADLVIAVFWSRMGAPVQDDESGTAHELKLAWESWKDKRKPDVWIYVCSRGAEVLAPRRGAAPAAESFPTITAGRADDVGIRYSRRPAS